MPNEDKFMGILKAPFPWFGGKSRVASLVWERFGDVKNYCEPFFGSSAVLLGRLTTPKIETVNDLDGFIANFWRALKWEPETVAYYADEPVNENDLHARHVWLVEVRSDLPLLLEGDPEYYDARVAGWWVWGISCWIGGEFCSGVGPWSSVDRQLVKNDSGQGISRRRPSLGSRSSIGVNRKRPNLSNAGKGVNRTQIDGNLYAYMQALSDRLRYVRVCCGDWERICGPTPTYLSGLTGVFLDPPYSDKAGRSENLYAVDDLNIATRVREWCLVNGDNKLMRIALCGYEGEGHEWLEEEGWIVVPWKAAGGYSSLGNNATGRANKYRERIWFSPHCC